MGAIAAPAVHPLPSPKVLRAVCGSALVCLSVPSWLLLAPVPCVLVSIGFVLMEATCICDIRAGIIPWEACLAMSALAIPFRVMSESPSSLLPACSLAVVLVFAFSLCNVGSRRFCSSPAIGAGDLRLIPALCVFCGLQGSLTGMFACATAMGACALFVLAMRWATPRTGIPLAPGLAIWLVTGVFAGNFC